MTACRSSGTHGPQVRAHQSLSMSVASEVRATADPMFRSSLMKKDPLTMEPEIVGLADVEGPDIQRRCCRDTKQCNMGLVDQRRNQHASLVFKGDVAAIE